MLIKIAVVILISFMLSSVQAQNAEIEKTSEDRSLKDSVNEIPTGNQNEKNLNNMEKLSFKDSGNEKYLARVRDAKESFKIRLL